MWKPENARELIGKYEENLGKLPAFDKDKFIVAPYLATFTRQGQGHVYATPNEKNRYEGEVEKDTIEKYWGVLVLSWGKRKYNFSDLYDHFFDPFSFVFSYNDSEVDPQTSEWVKGNPPNKAEAVKLATYFAEKGAIVLPTWQCEEKAKWQAYKLNGKKGIFLGHCPKLLLTDCHYCEECWQELL